MQTHSHTQSFAILCDYYCCCCCFRFCVLISLCSSHIIVIYRIYRHSANFRKCLQQLKIECNCLHACTLSCLLSVVLYNTIIIHIHCINGSLICRVCFIFFFFHSFIGTPINRLPIMAKSVLDLYELYNLVIARGGLVDVINKKLWQEIIKGLHLPSSITSAAFTLRTQ